MFSYYERYESEKEISRNETWDNTNTVHLYHEKKTKERYHIDKPR